MRVPPASPTSCRSETQFAPVVPAAELLEVFQWSGTDVNADDKRAKVEEELADVIMYCLSLADVEGMDVAEIVEKKLRRNNEKYPVDKAYGIISDGKRGPGGTRGTSSELRAACGSA